MAVTNTGIVERTIVGVNESDLFLDSEATSVTTNTGIVERSIVGVHDANFVRPLGDEEVLNGSFDTDSDWDFAASWSISGGKAICNASGGFGSFSQDGSLTIGKKYKITLDFDGSGIASGVIRMNGGSFSNSASERTLVNGENTLYLDAVSTSFGINESGATGIATIDNISVKEMLVTRESTTTNTGIVERAITGLSESITFRQDVRSNLIPYSEDFNNNSWAKATSGAGVAPIVTSNYAISPDGTQNAARIQFNATTSGSNSDRSRVITTLTLSDATDYTTSFYAKSTDGTDQKISILFDNSKISVKTIKSEWQRFEATSQQIGTTSICGLDLRGGNASTSDILVYGIQLEALSYANSYVSTSGVALIVDSNSTSVVNNTGIVERAITGLNESDTMFPNNTISNIINE